MIVVGAKGFAKEILQLLSCELNLLDNEIFFFDNVSNDLPTKLYNRFSILKSFEEVNNYISTSKDKNFVLGLGNPILRKKFFDKFTVLGFNIKSVISNDSNIDSFNTSIGEGVQIMQGVKVTSNVTIGNCVLINLNSTISHDTSIGDYVEIACGVNIAGRCTIENNVSIGTGAIIIPDISIGKNSIIGAGAVVINNVPPNVTVVGNPAKIIKHHE